jgi:histone H3/H4
MSQEAPQAELRITVSAIQELDQLARRFRRRLRDLAVELAGKAGRSGPIGTDDILRAVPLVAAEWVANFSGPAENERGLGGQEQDAA